jgi:hypothetical protein
VILLKLSDKEKDNILKCTKEIQSALFRGSNPNETFKKLRVKYSDKEIQSAMALLEHSRKNVNSPKNLVSKCINRCMNQVDKTKMNMAGDGTMTVDIFYEVCEEAYKVFMNDEFGRAMPIVFVFVKGNSTLGVIPIETENDDTSPMDYLKEIVYQEKPDAYCFCGEGSMNSNVEISEHVYGDIIDDPSSKDIVIMQGNTKRGDMPFQKMFDIEGEKGKLLFKKIDINADNMESDKLP